MQWYDTIASLDIELWHHVILKRKKKGENFISLFDLKKLHNCPSGCRMRVGNHHHHRRGHHPYIIIIISSLTPLLSSYHYHQAIAGLGLAWQRVDTDW